MTKSFEQRVWDASRGALHPAARQTVTPAIYDEVLLPASLGGVTFNCVVVLVNVTIKNGSARGTIIVPEGTTSISLSGSLVNIEYWSWARICREYRA